MFNERIPYNATILAQVTRHSVGDVEKAVQVLKQLDLIDVLENGAIYMLDIQNFIGKTSTEGDRKKEYRRRIEEEKKMLLSGGQITGHSSDNRPPEKEIEIEKEIDIEKEDNILSSKHDDIPYREIVDYLNEKTGSKYKHTTQSTKNGIKARYNEGFKLDDFKRVIDIKTSQWLYDTKMKQYLRPQTLFGTKFEAYLNEQPNVYQFEDSMKRDEKEPTPEEIAEFEKAREQFDKYKRTYAQNQS